MAADLEFVKKFTRPIFRTKEFYTLKMRKLRLFLPAINSKNASLSVIWPSFGSASRQDRRVLQKSKIIRIKFLSL